MMGIEQVIARIMKEKDLSLSGLAEQLGYRSKTSIKRILNGQVRPESLRKFEQALLNTFSLSEEEKAQLAKAIQYRIHGDKRYLTNQVIWDFIRGETTGSRRENLRIVDLQSGLDIDPHERYASAKALRLTIVNCQYVEGLFRCAYRLMRERGATVEHFIYVDDDDVRTIRTVSALMPMFYEKNYMGYMRMKPPADQPQDSGLNDGDWMIVSWTDAGDQVRSDAILFSRSYLGMLLAAPYMDEVRQCLIGLDRSAYQPIKRNYFECSAFEDYIQYSRDYAALEKDHAVWKLKPDPGVDQMPAWILKKAVEEGGTPVDEQFAETLDRLEAVYRDRFNNTFSKRKQSYTVFKRGAMRRFAMTGRTTDHFWMMRPFTPEERIVILTNLLRQQQENPFVHFYFLKDDSALRDAEIACYEGDGMLILDANTDYNLPEGHSEVMVTHPNLITLFRDFFMHELLKSSVCSEAETCDYFRHLIFEVEDLKDREERKGSQHTDTVTGER